MGKHQYKKPEATNIRGICVICNKNPQKKVGSTDHYMATCSRCNKKLYMSDAAKKKEAARVYIRQRPYRKALKETCEKCGFKPEHVCQLDVDHIDGDHSNHAETNLQTLCANCHRLKTYQQLWLNS